MASKRKPATGVSVEEAAAGYEFPDGFSLRDFRVADDDHGQYSVACTLPGYSGQRVLAATLHDALDNWFSEDRKEER